MKIWNLAYPRIGRDRELKAALESYWTGRSSAEDLEKAARDLCASRWQRQHELGVDSIPLGDFSFYDPMLDMAWTLGAIPEKFRQPGHWFSSYFAVARGVRAGESAPVAPWEMTKWFNTNYHYLVPEIDGKTSFKLDLELLRWQWKHARSFPYKFHPVIIGPWTFLKLSRLEGITLQEALKSVVPLYQKILAECDKQGFSWVQIDEPALSFDLTKEDLKLVRKTYDGITKKGPKTLLSIYYDSPDPWLSEIVDLPVEGFHFDLVNGPATLSWLKTRAFPKDKVLVLGLVNGRNIWAAPLATAYKQIEILKGFHPISRLMIAPGTPLAHLPVDKTRETDWDAECLSWVSFADQRLEELNRLKKALGGEIPLKSLEDDEAKLRARFQSPKIRREAIHRLVANIEPTMRKRGTALNKRVKLQAKTLGLPKLPTTTIGSFPQGSEVRALRAGFRAGKVNAADYEKGILAEIEKAIRLQERVGLDILVHGEAERGDMVEYFAQSLEGFLLTRHGWVQSYGSRCTRPPVLFGDVERKANDGVQWFQKSQALTPKPVKAIVTGPVTLLNWSFCREDLAAGQVAMQLGLAMRDEVKALQGAGAKVVQIDEPAFREGLPLKRGKWDAYLKWAQDAFRLVSGVVSEEVVLQVHLCYSELTEIIELLGKLEVDVLLLESARSGIKSLQAFKQCPVETPVGPGVYDIHSIRIPTVSEIERNVARLSEIFPVDKLWINPDCGMKTRTYEEVEAALKNMVDAAKSLRKRIKG